MKILFLDIDGVVNSVRSATAQGGYPWAVDEPSMRLFDPVAIALIKKLCDETETKIVLSSTWRMMFDAVQFGKKLGLPIIDKTPVMGSARGQEIKAWLVLNEHPKYAIVDDDEDMLEEQKAFFVRTDSYEGLSYRDYLQLKTLLN